jgi:hypothetical protein
MPITIWAILRVSFGYVWVDENFGPYNFGQGKRHDLLNSEILNAFDPFNPEIFNPLNPLNPHNPEFNSEPEYDPGPSKRGALFTGIS